MCHRTGLALSSSKRNGKLQRNEGVRQTELRLAAHVRCTTATQSARAERAGGTGTAGGPRFSLLVTLWVARRLRAESRLAPTAPGTVVLEKKRAESTKHQRGKFDPEMEPSRASLQRFHSTRTTCNSQPRNAPWAVRLFPGICELSPRTSRLL